MYIYIHIYVDADMHVNTYVHVCICPVESQGGERLVCLHSEVKKNRLYSMAHHSDVHL